MIGLHLSVQYSGYLSSARENAFVAVEGKKKQQQPQNKQKKEEEKNQKIQKSTLVDLSAISDDLVGRGKGGAVTSSLPAG